MTNRSFAIAIAVVVLVFDQLSKWAAVELLDQPFHLIGEFLELRIVRNPGGAFGSLQNAGVLLGIVAVIAVFILVRITESAERRTDALAFGLILGGALGNLTDRIFRGDGFLDGAVVDFVDFSFFPAFNVADSAVTIGAILAVLISIRRP